MGSVALEIRRGICNAAQPLAAPDFIDGMFDPNRLDRVRWTAHSCTPTLVGIGLGTHGQYARPMPSARTSEAAA